jgi:uncharacterized membrane protein YhaH (DUF805 family)
VMGLVVVATLVANLAVTAYRTRDAPATDA